MSEADNSAGNFRIVGALAGVGSGLTKASQFLAQVAVGHAYVASIENESRECSQFASSFDTVKTRMQCSPPGTYTGAVDVAKKIIRNEGFRGLYKGTTPPAVGWSAIDAVLLGSLHNYRLLLVRQGMTEPTPGKDVQRLTLLGHGVAGLFAGLTSAFVATPLELVKVKLQLQVQKSSADRQFRSTVDCIRQVVRVQGLPGLWSGMTGSLATRCNFFWMFLSFEGLMREFSRLEGTSYEISTGLANFLSGGLASFAFWAFAIPADNVKNRMMAQPLVPSVGLAADYCAVGPRGRPSFGDIACEVHAREGLRGFFRGLGPTFLRAFPSNGSAFFVYEGTMRVMGAEKTRH